MPKGTCDLVQVQETSFFQSFEYGTQHKSEVLGFARDVVGRHNVKLAQIWGIGFVKIPDLQSTIL